MNRLLIAVFFLLSMSAASVSAADLTNVSANDFTTVFPKMINLTLDQGEMVTEKVALTIHPYCVRPYKVDVVASDPDALVTNVTGIVVNGCGGDTSTFEIEITGTGASQFFDLQFIDAEFGGVLGSIPVTIKNPAHNVEPLIGLLIRSEGILFQVASGGCTTKDDFKVEVLESYPLQLRLIRLQEDPCDAYLPLGTRIRFTFRELGINPGDLFRVVNPLGTIRVPWRSKL